MSWPRMIVSSLSAKGPAAVAEIARRLGLTSPVTSVCVRRLHVARRVHIVAWQTAQRAVYAAGDGVDKARPAPRTIAQISAAYERRRRADPVRYVDKIMSDRAYYARKRRPPPQSWISLLQ